MPTLAKTSPFAPSRKGAPCYFLCESHRYAGNNRWVLWPHARNASGKFRFFQVLERLIACNAGPGQLGRWNANPITLASAQVARSISCAPCRVPLHHVPIPTVGALGARRDQRAHCCCGQSPSSQGQSIHSVASAFRRRTPSRQQIQSRWYAERAPSKPLQSRNRFLNGAPAR